MIVLRGRWICCAGAALCLLLAGLAARLVPAWRQPLAAVPELDLSAAHPQVAETIHAAQEEVRRHPRSGAAWGRLGTVLMAHELDTAAIACLRQAVILDPRQFRWPYLCATIEEHRDLDRALANYERAAALQPSHAPLRWRLAILLQRLGRLDDAERQFREAARLAPDSQYPWLGMGRAAMSRGDKTTARRCFESAVERAPWDRAAQFELARICGLTGDLATAAKCREQAAFAPEPVPIMPDPILHAIDRLQSQVLLLAGTADALAARGDLAHAAAAFRALSVERQDLARPRINLGITLQRMGDLPGAAAVFREVAKDFPSDPLAHYQLALALGLLQDPAGAIQSYHDCLTIKPDFAQAFLGLGITLKNRGDMSGAVAALRQAVEADPQLASAYLSLGTIELDRGNHIEAVHDLEYAVKLSPDDPVARAYLQRAKE